MNKTLIILFGAIAALAFAFYFQYAQGLHPCELCIAQRWGYVAAVLFALIALKNKRLRILVSLALLAEAAIAIYHTGIEQRWWEGFQNCSSGLQAGMSIDEIRAKLMGTPLVRCDEPVWFFAGLSMAAWNVIYSSALFVLSLLPCRKST